MRPSRACLLATLLLSAAPLPRPSPARAADTTRVVPGLAQPATVLTDVHGIPHLEAAALGDLYFTWGWVTARDRLWQLEHSRRAARGDLWRWLGNATLVTDGAAQLLELEAFAERAWRRDSLDPAVRVPLERYAAGINAWIAACRRGEQPWPSEFRRLGRRPADWRPVDSMLMLYALGVMLDLAELPELAEAREVSASGPAAFLERRRFENDVVLSTVPDSVVRRLHGEGDLRGNGLGARSPAGDGGAPPAPSPALEPLAGRAARALAGIVREEPEPDLRASNVFAAAPARTEAGRALLANDPHLKLTAPGALHVLHVTVADSLDAVGAAVPGLPVIVSGRNPRMAWGITALSADVADVYADTLSADGTRVRWNGGWVPLREEPFDLRFRKLGVSIRPPGRKRRWTPHGPVLSIDRKARLALSLRWTGLTDEASLRGLLGLERSRDVRELAARARTVVTPGINLVMADLDGHVRYQAVGRVPVRPFAHRPGPLPARPEFEWDGFIPPDSMPAWDVPADGVVVNANNLPAAGWPWPFERYDWPQDRALRIAERLGADASLTAADLRSVQSDIHARAAARLLPALLEAADSLAADAPPGLRASLDTLRAWDHVARRESTAPTLYRAWLGAINRRSALTGLPGLLLAGLEGRADTVFRAPADGRKPAVPAHERPAVAVRRALERAHAELAKRLGPDPALWTWARAHRARFSHPLAGKHRHFHPDEPALDGDNSSPAVAPSGLPWRTTVTAGPVFRHVVDLAVADSSWFVVPPGNRAGLATETHASDLLGDWSHRRYRPLYLSWESARAARREELRLEPAEAAR